MGTACAEFHGRYEGLAFPGATGVRWTAYLRATQKQWRRQSASWNVDLIFFVQATCSRTFCVDADEHVIPAQAARLKVMSKSCWSGESVSWPKRENRYPSPTCPVYQMR